MPQSLNTAAGVATAIQAVNSAFAEWSAGNDGNVNVDALLGDNLNFEEAIGTQNSNSTNVFDIPGWNENMTTNRTGWSMMKYLQDSGSPDGGNALQIRENWKGTPSMPSTLQLYKDVVLPAGDYLLSFNIRIPYANFTESLCYYEIDGVRTAITASTSWEKKIIPVSVSEPVVFRLSFGFVAGIREGNYSSEVDVDGVSLTLLAETMKEGKESMEDGWTQLTALPFRRSGLRR